MTKSTPPLDVDYSRYERLKAEGGDAETACRLAVSDEKSFLFQVRMLRSVFGLDIAQARDLAGQARRSTRAMRSERLFSYGTLRQEEVQRAIFGRLLEGWPDVLAGFVRETLEITDRDVLAKSGTRFHAIAVRTGDPADRIAGTVFLITPQELSAADAYEVDDYERVSVTLASGLDAWVYVGR